MKGYPGLTKLLTEHDLEVKERLEKRQLFRWARWISYRYAQHEMLRDDFVSPCLRKDGLDEMLRDLPEHSDKQ